MVALLACLASASGAWADPTPGAGNRSAPPVRTDRYGDPLPEGVLARLGTVRFRGSAFWLSPEETILAIDSANGIRLCDARTGRLRHALPVDNPAASGIGPDVSFSPDGKMLVLTTEQLLSVWDTARGRRLWQARVHWPDATFTADGKQLLVHLFRERVLRVRDSATGKVLRTLRIPGHDGDGPFRIGLEAGLLAAGTGDGTVTVCDLATGKRLLALPVPDKVVPWLGLSRNGKTLAAGGQAGDGWLRVWSLPAGKPWPLAVPMDANPGCLRVSDDGTTVCCNTQLDEHRMNFGVYVWHRGAGKAPQFFTPDDGIHDLALSPSGRLLAVAAPPYITLWQSRPPRKLRVLRGGLDVGKHLYFSADEKRLHARDDHAFRSWDLATGRELHALPGHAGQVQALAFSGDGRTVATGGPEGGVRVWEATTGRQLQQLPGDDAFVTNLALSGDGQVVASYSSMSDMTVHLWEVGTRRLRGQFEHLPELAGGQPGSNYGVALDIAHDGRTLAVTSIRSRSIKLWDVAAGKMRRELRCAGYAQTLAFSPDGRTLARASQAILLQPSPIELWDVRSGDRAARPVLAADRFAATELRFSPDGRMLAALGVTEVVVWELASRQPVHRFRAPGMLSALVLTPQGRVLAAQPRLGPGLRASKVDVWDVFAGKVLNRFEDRGVGFGAAGLWPMAFSPDGHLLATVMNDTTAVVWDLRPFLAVPRRRPTGPDAPQLERYWNELAGEDAARAYKAVGRLTAVPEAAVSLLRQRLMPQAGGHYPELVAQLDSKQFKLRAAASKELARLGVDAEPALRAALRRDPSPEVRRRIEQLLRDIAQRPPAPEVLRRVRSIQILEQIGSPAARDILQTLAKGDPDAWLTREAKASLDRLRPR
jgi:WD40 repeat protein